MKILVLGKGKTGGLVAEIARERGHEVRVIGSAENADGAAVSASALRDVDVVIEFTTPHAVIANVEACLRAKKDVVIGTTGWYGEIARVQALAETSGAGCVFGANFSVGVNLFFEIARASAAALNLGYTGTMVERHHSQKKDAPSGTAVAINKVLREASGRDLEIESVREGNIVGDHELRFESANDVIELAHSAKSRRGFAEGAVKAAEWVRGKKGFFDFRDVWRELGAG
ncbi:MAG TPA: dihydrodipicolinate reductase C-terminal domain-containing protein [Terriglobales bacterium]|nr:dihydrodipicolinate reductase C-terminal domain-containing protein [Terriglobales bacterium]